MLYVYTYIRIRYMYVTLCELVYSSLILFTQVLSLHTYVRIAIIVIRETRLPLQRMDESLLKASGAAPVSAVLKGV